MFWSQSDVKTVATSIYQVNIAFVGFEHMLFPYLQYIIIILPFS